MSHVSKSVCHVGPLASPEFNRLVGAPPDVTIHSIDIESSPLAERTTLAAAQIYQIGSTRDDTPQRWWVDASLLAQMPRLLAVSTNGSGFDTVDVDACTAAGVLAVNQAGGNAEAVAEHVLGMMLVLSKRIGETDRHLRRSTPIRRTDYKGRDIKGRTLGVVGFGHVGRRLARLCKEPFGMRLLVHDPYVDDAVIAEKGGQRTPLDELLSRADFISINCPLTAETRGMIGAREFSLMQRHAYFITTARGFIHDESALVAALRERRIAGAGVDVWEREPPSHDHPLMAFDNVLLSPHTAGVTYEARDNVARIGAEQVLAILDGHRPPRLLNPEVWPVYRQRFADIAGRQTVS